MMVSVVMPVYNAERTVEAAINSVLSQTYRDFELIIIDDCSFDGTADVARILIENEPKARLCKLDKNNGVAFARNFGVSLAKGEWIAFIDGDDYWDAQKLELQMALIGETHAEISFTASTFMDYGGKPCKYILKAPQRIRYKDALRRNLLSCSSVVVRRDLMVRHRMPRGYLHEDYASWLSILREVKYAYGLNKPLLTYRISRHSRSGRRMASAAMVFHTYRYVGYNPLSSFLLTLRYIPYSLWKRFMIFGYN